MPENNLNSNGNAIDEVGENVFCVPKDAMKCQNFILSKLSKKCSNHDQIRKVEKYFECH